MTPTHFAELSSSRSATTTDSTASTSVRRALRQLRPKRAAVANNHDANINSAAASACTSPPSPHCEPTSAPSSTMGTLIVSLPSGRILGAHFNEAAQCANAARTNAALREFVRIGDSLLDRLDGKGAQILQLQAFCGTPHRRMYARLKLGEQTLACEFVCEFRAEPNETNTRLATIHVRALTTPSAIAATTADGAAALQCEFTTRHNSSCSIIYFDAAAVPCLGRFPSELTGGSLFDIVHADDAPLIHDVHRQLRAGARLARSTGLRFVDHDGGGWLVDSEWACFTNPWSGIVEMIVARHRVRGRDTKAARSLDAIEVRRLNALTRQTLEGPAAAATSLAPLTGEQQRAQQQPPPSAVSPPLTKTSADDSPSPAHSPDLQLSYHQINCLENVHRLLKSQNSTSSRSAPADIERHRDEATTAPSSAASPATASAATTTAALTRDILGEHDRRWQAEKTRTWTQRLKTKRAAAAAATSAAALMPPAPKVARLELAAAAAASGAQPLLSLLGSISQLLDSSSPAASSRNSPPAAPASLALLGELLAANGGTLPHAVAAAAPNVWRSGVSTPTSAL